MNTQKQLADIHHSGKPYIIYKSGKGFDLYTNFSKKIILNNKNVESFLNKKYKNKKKETDLFIGFFGYELLNNLINIKLPNQKNINFPKGIFYKPEKKIKITNKDKPTNVIKYTARFFIILLLSLQQTSHQLYLCEVKCSLLLYHQSKIQGP